MAAPEGNSFWKMRKRSGRPQLFESASTLWESACDYFDWCSTHPWERRRTVQGKETEVTVEPIERPFTLSGLCVYMGTSVQWWYSFKKRMKEDKDFFDIITRIEEIIETQQFEGAVVGAFNSNIIARKLGLTDKKKLEEITRISGLNIIVLNDD